MDEDARPVDPPAAAFDVVLRGYHRGQVDAYVQALQERCTRSAAALQTAERRLAGDGATASATASAAAPVTAPAVPAAVRAPVAQTVPTQLVHLTESVPPVKQAQAVPCAQPAPQPGIRETPEPAETRVPEQGAGVRMERLIARAEEEAAEIREIAEAEAAQLRSSAEEEAVRVRTSAEEDARHLRTSAEEEAVRVRTSAEREAAAVRAAAKQEAAGLLTEHADRLEELRLIRDRIDSMPGLRATAAH